MADCQRPIYGRGLCQLHYQRWRKHGDPLISKLDRSPGAFDRLAARSATVGECHVWLGRTDACGYGLIDWQGKGHRTHRLAYEMHHGPISGGLIVCHRCDNPPCMRLDHLFLGTDADNSQDRDRKGRQVAPPGMGNGNAVLTDADVRAIRAAHAAGRSQQSLSEEYRVTRANIGYIVRRITWKHLD